MTITPHHQAILLLTTHLPGSKKNAERPLTTLEWNQVAMHLKMKQMDPESLLEVNGLEALKDLNTKGITIERLKSLLSRSMVLGISMQKWLSTGMWVLTRKDEHYPKCLKKLGRFSPPVLFGFGDVRLLNNEIISIVGSRNADSYDLEVTQNLARIVSKAGVTVLSGAARGVDETAMIAALDYGGISIGVTSDSLLRSATSSKYREWIKNGLLSLISPYNPEARFDVGNAMSRNKIVYAMSKAAFIIASDAKKGGTWTGAIENLRNSWTQSYVLSFGNVKTGNLELLKSGCLPFTEEMLDVDFLKNLVRSEIISAPVVVQDKKKKNTEGKQISLEF